MKSIATWTKEIRDYVAQTFDPWLGWESLPKGLMYLVTELSEAMEAWRDNDKQAVAEELADTAIRLFDTAGALDIDLEAEIAKKMKKNWNRPRNHGRENV